MKDIAFVEDFNAFKDHMHDIQMEIDIFKEIDKIALTNREKAEMIDALKNKYSLPGILKTLFRNSGYYYQKIIYAEDKYFILGKINIKLFHENRDILDY